MNRRFFTLALFLGAALWPCRGWATIAITTHTYLSAGGAGNTLTTGTLDTTGSNLLVSAITYQNSASVTMQDSKGNVWTALTASPSGGNQKTQMFYSSAPIVGTGQTFTASGTGIFASIGVIAVSGAATGPNPFDKQAAAETATTTTIQPGSVTPSLNNEIVITALGYKTAGFTISINGGFTISDSGEFNANNYGGSMAYLIQTTAAAANPTWTRGAGNDDMSTAIATFEVAPTTTPGFLLIR